MDMLGDIDVPRLLHDADIIWKGGRILFAVIDRVRRHRSREVALVVQLSMSPVKDVRRFLDTQGIEADLILVTRPDAGASGMMPVDAAVWEETVREFHRGFSAVQEERGAQRFHLFMSAPTVLAFAMGCTVSTQYDFHLYQWVPESGRYVEVIRGVTRDRLMRAP